jgi:hypothetical protein
MQYIFGVVAFIFVLAFAAQRRYLTSIADIPGPLFASISRAWHLWRLIKGDIDQHCIALHEKHGMPAICAIICAIHGYLIDKHRIFRPHQP